MMTYVQIAAIGLVLAGVFVGAILSLFAIALSGKISREQEDQGSTE